MKTALIGLMCLCTMAHADINPWQKSEVQHLLQFVADSPCEFERNGDKVNGADAAEHMLKKYQHFANEITSAEDFIRLAASKSEVSGKPYLVYCKNVPTIASADYLRNELGKYRIANGK
jgi:hypothetical protein